MSDERFYKKKANYKVSELAALIDCEVVLLNPANKNVDTVITDLSSLAEANKGHLSFLSNKKYREEVKTTKASACIVPLDFDLPLEQEIWLLKTKNPYFAYAKAIDLFYEPIKDYANFVSDSAYIANSAKLGKNCYIGHNVVIEDGVEIGENSLIESGSYIGPGVKIGSNAKIYANVSISYSLIGDNVVILPGARIGQDGFGFATEAGRHYKIFHIGRVIIGNDVEIGANTTIDRGSLNDTIIEDNCRIDNLVQLGHNAKIGKGSILVAQVGIAGSSKIGSYCALGGQVGVAGHLNIGDRVQVVGQSGIIKDVDAGSIVGGTPAVPVKEWHKQTLILKKLIKE